MADDNLKHIDTSTPEIRELVENIVGKSLGEAVNEGAFCPRCVAITLLGWASYAAVSAGATASDVMGAAADGAATAEQEAEAHAEDGGFQETRH